MNNKVRENCSKIVERLTRLHIKEFEGARNRVNVISERYPGVWLEHMFDGIALGEFDESFYDVALGQIRVFFDKQKDDGRLPCIVFDSKSEHLAPYLVSCPDLVRYRQIQECVSVIGLCNRFCGDDTDLLQEFYPKCVLWDRWISENRVKDGLVQAYHQFDTGHDNSARFEGDVFPVSAVDMTAVYTGGKLALSEMAQKLGLKEESEMWYRDFADAKKVLFEKLYDPEDAFFYDLDKDGNRIPYRTIAVTALFSEHILTKEEADVIFDRHFRNPDEFATPYPYPAVAINDKGSRPEHKENSWSFYSQANTALRTLLWMDYYGFSKEQEQIMKIWLEAWTDDDTPFGQELHPVTGKSSGCSPWYSPTMIFYLHCARRLGYIN